MTIRHAVGADVPALAGLAAQLWPQHPAAELAASFASLLAGQDAACFLAFWQGRLVGFAQCQLRHDPVEGAHTCPVGYLEGIFVDAACRRRGCARSLVAACEAWARQQGCQEFASDCALTNTDSFLFHLATGFAEAGRIICFRKDL